MNKGRKYYASRNRRRSGRPPGFVREYAYDKEGNAVMQDGSTVSVSDLGDVTKFDKSKQAYRERPNRKMKRMVYAEGRKRHE